MFENKKREFFDDYAHHPTEIKSVLNSLRKINKNRKIISVFQPHRYSRLKLLKNEFASSFKNANLVILCPVFPAGEKIDKNYNRLNFARLISKKSNVQLIKEAGCANLSIGGAKLSQQHCNFFVNDGKATAKDIEKLIMSVKNKVYSKTGIKLDLEIIFLISLSSIHKKLLPIVGVLFKKFKKDFFKFSKFL